MVIRAFLEGIGGYLPETIVGNEELAQRIDTTNAWIVERTGIRQRHIAKPHETAAFMGTRAAEQALFRAGATAADVDCIILGTSTPDEAFPATALRVQAALGVKRGFGFDVSAACSGFVYALGLADSLIRTGQSRGALVIGSEVYSRILDWTDRGTCVLFGDGAGAVFLRAGEGGGTGADRGVLSTHLHAQGDFGNLLYIDGAVGQPGRSHKLRMNGREIFRHAVAKLSAVVEEALSANGLSHGDIDWLVPHQANLRIIDAMGRKLGLAPERVVVTVDRHANTSAASIPLALADADAAGRLKPGELIVLEALGGGLTWGSALVRL
jgi:3-oxoacyl-[acyl-carrier-protein] synthase-3